MSEQQPAYDAEAVWQAIGDTLTNQAETAAANPVLLERMVDLSRFAWARAGEYATTEDALMHVRGDWPYRISNRATGEEMRVRARYGGGLEASTDNGATWQRIARPGASPVIGLGVHRKAIEKGFAANPASRGQATETADLDTVRELARRGAAINAASGR